MSDPIIDSKMVTFVMDDTAPRVDRRKKVADLINKAVDDGAQAIVLDVFYEEPSDNDHFLREAFKKAQRARIPVFIGTQGKKSIFSDVASVGHILANVNPNSTDTYPNGTSVTTRSHFGGFLGIGGRDVYALSAQVASRVTHCNEKPKRDLEDLPPRLRYQDVPVNPISYNTFKQTNMSGAIVFVGGSIAPESGNPEDVVRYDNGNTGPGVADIVSQVVAYRQKICFSGNDLVERIRKNLDIVERSGSFWGGWTEARRREEAHATTELAYDVQDLSKYKMELPSDLQYRFDILKQKNRVYAPVRG